MKKLEKIHVGKALKGTATLTITTFYMKDLNKPWILIPVSSKSGEKLKVAGVWIFANGL